MTSRATPTIAVGPLDAGQPSTYATTCAVRGQAQLLRAAWLIRQRPEAGARGDHGVLARPADPGREKIVTDLSPTAIKLVGVPGEHALGRD